MQTQTKDDVECRDIMVGVPRITVFLRELLDDPKLPDSKVYNWIAKGYIPSGSLGAKKTGSKRKIRDHLSEATNTLVG
jgi:hypothetical protein